MSEVHKELGQLPKKTWRERLLAFTLIFVIVLLTSYGVKYMISSKPKATRKPPQPIKGIVEVTTIKKGDAVVSVEGLGYIKAASEVVVKSEVSGKIVTTPLQKIHYP